MQYLSKPTVDAPKPHVKIGICKWVVGEEDW